VSPQRAATDGLDHASDAIAHPEGGASALVRIRDQCQHGCRGRASAENIARMTARRAIALSWALTVLMSCIAAVFLVLGPGRPLPSVLNVLP
jgi:hypothetical protein